MITPVVHVHRVNGTVTLEIRRPEARNALNGQVLSELLAGLDEAEADPAVSAVVITGAGDAFSAGGDLKEAMEREHEPYLLYEADGLYTKLLMRLRSVSKPTVAAVNGMALGGGLGLVAGCDLAIASDRAEFGTPEVRVGTFPLMLMAPVLSILGPKAAFELFMTAGTLNAQEAKALGLVNRVVPHAEFLGEVANYAASLEGNSPIAVKLGKKAFYTLPGMGYDQALEYLKGVRSVLSQTHDAAEGRRAFVEKRPPRWTGR